MMNKFKIGDRVQLIESGSYNGYGRYGETGEAGKIIDYTDYDHQYEVNFEKSGRWWAEEDNLRLANLRLAVAAHGAPISQKTTVQKGDKFRVNRDDKFGSYSNGDVFEAVSADDDGVDFYDHDGTYRYISQDDITLVDDHGEPWDHDPRALRIEAGKYYRTRDGRKVGPMRRGAIAFIVRNGDGFSWQSDGKCFSAAGDYTDPHDIIAEWTDEPVAATAEPAKFKVGDRVRYNGTGAMSARNGATAIVGSRGHFKGDITDVQFIDIVWDRNGLDNGQMDGGYEPDAFELADPEPIRPGTRVLIEGVVNSIDGKTAHVDIIGPDVPYNRSYPLSALRAV